MTKFFYERSPLQLSVFFSTNFRQSSTWKIWSRPIQRIFHGKNDSKWPDFDFWFFDFFQIARFYDKFQYVAKNIERLLFFYTFILICSQIWLNYFWIIDRHFGYITKSLKENLLELHQKIGKRAIPLTLTPSFPSPPPIHTHSWRIWNLVCWHVSKQRSLGGLILGETNILKIKKLKNIYYLLF